MPAATYIHVHVHKIHVRTSRVHLKMEVSQTLLDHSHHCWWSVNCYGGCAHGGSLVLPMAASHTCWYTQHSLLPSEPPCQAAQAGSLYLTYMYMCTCSEKCMLNSKSHKYPNLPKIKFLPMNGPFPKIYPYKMYGTCSPVVHCQWLAWKG